ncbi:MAG TPA: hypothetical protein VKB09_09825 [Thermomicrobiales bacterium]|nr:hypothetical protein [Thermomicrobiales bacterium]
MIVDDSHSNDKHSRTTVTLSVAASLSAATELALTTRLASGVEELNAPVIVADGTQGSAKGERFGQRVADLLSLRAPDVQLVVPPRPLADLIGRAAGRGADRVAVNLGDRAERVSAVGLPRSLVEAGSVVAVNDVRLAGEGRPMLAIGLWARFAGWRERAGARLAKPEDGLAAEIALAVRPRLILLVDTWRGATVVVATADQVAAELSGLALRQERDGYEDDQLGPWQDPLVQRATDLDLGVRVPNQIALRGVVAADPDDARKHAWSGLIQVVADRLGVRDISVSRPNTAPGS